MPMVRNQQYANNCRVAGILQCQLFLCAIASLSIAPSCLAAQEFLKRTEFVEVEVGGGHSADVHSTSRRGYELESGEFQSFRKWYTTRQTDIRAELTTQLDENTWFLWGLSTGETGEKYEIESSLTLGLEHAIELGRSSVLVISAKKTFGGYLRERTCSATYTLASGPQLVNCRLAASVLSPDATLDYLWNSPPPNQIDISVSITWLF